MRTFLQNKRGGNQRRPCNRFTSDRVFVSHGLLTNEVNELIEPCKSMRGRKRMVTSKKLVACH